MIEFWQHLPERISPVFFSLGPVQVRWYGMMYLFAFITVYSLSVFRTKNEKIKYDRDTIEDFFVWAILGVLLGGRIGYVLFYNIDLILTNPIAIILPVDLSDGLRFTGFYGMSYHGGLLGVIFSFVFFCRKRQIKLWHFIDLFVPAIPLGYTFGRIGNFINGELYGRVTSVPWGMYFPTDVTYQLRHPSQLYEAFFEGIFLFAVLWCIRKRSRFDGFLSAVYIVGYGCVRFFIEFYREPDAHLGFVLGPLSMGQVLCVVMILSGIFIYIKQNLQRS